LAVMVLVPVLQRDRPAHSIALFEPSDAERQPTSPEQERILALATLEASARKVLAPRLREFWKSEAIGAGDGDQAALDEQLDAMREAIVRRFGPAAVDDPLFVRLFKPLNRHFPYLSSKSQLALARLQRTRGMPAADQVPMTAFDPAAMYRREQEFGAAVRNVLTPAEYDEYQLRESPAARLLRSSGVEFDEKEFRAAFDALQQMDADRSAGAYLAGQEKLREVLGSRRFAQFSARGDPKFAGLEEAGRQHQLSRDQTLEV